MMVFIQKLHDKNVVEVVEKVGVHRLHDLLKQLITGDTLKSQNSKVTIEECFCVSKFILEATVQVIRSLRTKSLDTNRIFSRRFVGWIH